jgi:tol-pal system protein YbgF
MDNGDRRTVKGKCNFHSTLAVAAGAALLTLAFSGHAQLFGGDDVARKDIAEQGKRIEALSQRLARMEESVQGMTSANPALELAQQLEVLREEMRQLRGQIEVLGHESQMAAKRQRDMYVDLDTRLRRLEQPSAPIAAPTGAAPAPASGGTPPAVAPTPPASAPPVVAAAKPAVALAPSDTEARSYEAAQGQRRIGNYQGAITAFQGFINQYPKSPLAPRAQYWIGDSYYNLRDFKRSIAAQQKLIATYPGSSSVPDALLNMASSQIELDDIRGARRTLDGIVTRYPTSEAAVKAKRRLANLK